MTADRQIDTAADVLGEWATRGAPLGARTTYRVGGPAALAVELTTREELGLLCQAVSATGIEVLIVGKGSNLLVADSGFAGLAVFVGTTGPWGDIRVNGTAVVAGSGVNLPVLARRSAAAGRSGLEWAVGVPGSVGGAVRMNAGGHGSDIASCLVSAEVADLRSGEVSVRQVESLDFGYRSSSLRPQDLVISAEFVTTDGVPTESAELIDEIVQWRRENQPGGQNAGSVFVNPAGDSAGRLVDAAGCRGLRHGNAIVSSKHANFIQADPGGRAEDVLQLIREVRARVEDHSGVRLTPELRMVGWD